MLVEVSGKHIAVTLEMLRSSGNSFRALKRVNTRNALGIRLLGVSRISNPKKSGWQSCRVELCQSDLEELRHQSLVRKLMATKQLRHSLRLVGSLSKDAGTDSAKLGFSNENASQR
jgi:hypothetical protein